MDYKTAMGSLFKLHTGLESATVINKISFEKDVGTFTLYEGTFYTCITKNDKILGVFFEGKGDFSFAPPTKIEEDQLYRFYDKDDFPINFNSLFLLFTDSTYFELDRLINFELSENNYSVNDEISDRLEYLKKSDEGYSRSDFIRSILDEPENGFFYAHIEGAGGPYFFQINPYQAEEVCFMRSYKSGYFSKSKKEIINQFPVSIKYQSLTKPDKNFLDIISYRIESTIEDNLDFSAECALTFISSEKKSRWITFYLFEELEVDSIIWEDGSEAKFYRTTDNTELWIRIDDKYLDEKEHMFKTYYHGELLERNQLGWISIKSSSFWYPRYNSREKAYFGLHFETPVEYNFISVGDCIKSSSNDEVLSTTWMCNEPIVNASFNIGKFEEHEVVEKGLPKVKVYMSEYGHKQLGHQLAPYGILTLGDAIEWIGGDVINSLSLFDNMFGRISHPTINVTEVPYFHGLAFPGLIHLSWITYQASDLDGSDEIFRAHEVAHQWWGIGVDYKTYHDKWLSEGFAQYSGLLYLQVIKKDNDLFFEHLERWCDRIMSNREYILGSGQEAGPVWLGYRTQSYDTEGDYSLIVYKKGAYILHMLRSMLLNLNTMNEDLFKNMMKDYFRTFYGKAASTEDFKRIVSKHFGEDMEWFFNQYVYGTDLPLYRFAYKTEKTVKGKYRVTCRITQEDVPENFKMYIPIKIIFDDERYARLRIEMKTKEKIFTLPLLPEEPEDIIFNDLHAVLCEVDYEDWD
jgi:hypothetical protein